MENKFLICKKCGNLIGKIEDSGAPIFCCGEPMDIAELNCEEDANPEKHLPVVTREFDGLYVQVGEVLHPMFEHHSIEWIYLETLKGGQRKKCIDKPCAKFVLSGDDMATAVYAYCNIHGLWRVLL